MCLLMESPKDLDGFDALFVFLSRFSICNGVPVNSIRLLTLKSDVNE